LETWNSYVKLLLLMQKTLKIIFTIFLYGFAIIGFGLVVGFFAVKFGLTNTRGIIDNQNDAFYKNNLPTQNQIETTWANTEEWKTFKAAIVKDKDTLSKVELKTGVPARMIISVLAVEQLRLFTSEREFYKQAFSPLKILGTQTQFSWGVMGIKPDTAKQIENNLASSTSPYYLGKDFEHTLDFTSATDTDQERFSRITDEHNRYYAYLYGALYIKEIEQAWKNSGNSIDNKPEIIGTLYNIGFGHSEPKANPQVGGAEIEVGGIKYSFGGLTYNIYRSNELLDLFPRP